MAFDSMDNGPLTGIKVIDLTQIYQGPYAAFLMASAGAEVIKIEPIGGERLRGHGRAPGGRSLNVIYPCVLIMYI